MTKRIFQISALVYLLLCIYLVTFAGMDFKELQNENWFLRSSYMIGLLVCAPVGLVLGLAPESWNPGVFISNLVVAIPSALLVITIVFYVNLMKYLKKSRHS
ncbi:MAG: hypothetical protein ABW080_04750 [Candidatus Thiodiazotropha sp.]